MMAPLSAHWVSWPCMLATLTRSTKNKRREREERPKGRTVILIIRLRRSNAGNVVVAAATVLCCTVLCRRHAGCSTVYIRYGTFARATVSYSLS
ncbi:uncharacterized protein J3D65DRAFT_620050 [Phyllosticta citribraziliensis]|uniref:Secreted protein n=1 Tax=Phyllosticta citribraziliensis TaxID=989973 RepID=A0ABR1LYZ5_9PEZI